MSRGEHVDMWANASASEGVQTPEFYIPYVVSEATVAITAVIGNALVIFVFYKTPTLRHARNYYIISLAIADLLVGLVGIPLAVLNSVGLPASRHACLFSLSTLLVLCTISICCLVGVSIDRIWATTNPVTYHRKMNASNAICIIVVCWGIGAVIGFLPLLGWYNHKGWEAIHRCEFTKVINYDYLAFLFFATCLVPLFLLAGIYGYIYKKIIQRLRRHTTRKLRSESRDFTSEGEGGKRKQSERSSHAHKLREARAAKKLGSIVLFFAVCWMPLYTINCIQAFVDLHVPPIIMLLVIILSHANSAVNPLMYAFYLRDFRSAMKNTLLNGLRVIVPCRSWQFDAVDYDLEHSRTHTSKGPHSGSEHATVGIDLNGTDSPKKCVKEDR